MKLDISDKTFLAMITANMVGRLEDYQTQYEKDTWDNRKKILSGLSYIGVDTIDNLLMGKKVSNDTYEAIFQNKQLEELARTLSEEITAENPHTLKEVTDLIENLEKRALLDNVREIEVDFLEVALTKLRKGDKRRLTRNELLLIYLSQEANKLSEDENIDFFRLLSNQDMLKNIMTYLPLLETIFQSEEALEIFCNVADRLEQFRRIHEAEKWETIDEEAHKISQQFGINL